MRIKQPFRLLLWVFVIGSLAFSTTLQPQAAKSKELKLSILYTTDLYGQLRDFRCKRPNSGSTDEYEPASRDISNLLYQVQRIRREVVSKNSLDSAPTHGLLTFNTGDNLATAASARFLLEFKGLSGVDFIAEIFSRFGFSLIGIGNHEFSVPSKKLATFIKQSRLKYLKFSVANLTKAPPNHVFSKEINHNGIKKTKYFIFNAASLKIGAFHVVPQELENKVAYAKHLKFGDPAEAINEIVPILRKQEKVDLVIMLSHLDNGSKGKNIRDMLSTNADDPDKHIDLVITNGMRENDKPIASIMMSGQKKTYIVGGYKYGSELGRVNIHVRKGASGSQVTSFAVKSVPLKDNERDQKLRRQLIKWERSYCKRWGKPLGKGRLRKEMDQEKFAKYFLNYMRMLGQAEVAIINKGAIPSGKPFPLKGYITKDDLYRAIPFPQEVYFRTMTGEELNNLEKKDSLLFGGYTDGNINGREIISTGKYRVVAIRYVAENRGGWMGETKGSAALKKWKPLTYKNGNHVEIRQMIISHFATNGHRDLPYTPPPKPQADDGYGDDGSNTQKKKPTPPPKPFTRDEIVFTGDFYRLNERVAWSFKSSAIVAFESIFANPINLSGLYGDSQSFSNQFYKKYQVNAEINLGLKLHTSKHEWNNEFVLGYTLYASQTFNSESSQDTSITQEERDEVRLSSKYVLKPFSSNERKWYHTNPFLRLNLQTEITTGNRPDLTGAFNVVSLEAAKKFFAASGESELYHRFRFESELGLTFNIEKANLTLDLSVALRRQFALNPFTQAKANLGLPATLADLTINTNFNLGGSIKASISELQLFVINKTPFVWSTSVRYTMLFQVGASSSGLLIHDFEWKNKFAFKLQGNIELAFGVDTFLYKGIFKPKTEVNFFQEGPFAVRIDPKVSLNISWGARGQAL